MVLTLLRSFGDSKIIIIPNKMVKKLNLHIGDRVRIRIENNELFLSRRTSERKILTAVELFEDYEEEYFDSQVFTFKSGGREEW
ncbi:AbrB/MazE/SpoVT family DNA-binding domain-containing protein [Floricoccus penangensis]|uniref:SpoVT-AbrB domain-containing protein n=1 Tax=Floricoccus penangensis TaxID=1859475 RepID=A0A9Q5JF88_9LACT|nr:AbrB/MazE/SpoVT family DNA-binding domain-containing protein [Floricoccus penangensis]OFI46166.1 hypothetical protein BG262_03905 [Floricoccus penangensis]URZ86888.1 hypothetical protein KIW23_07300 [Floricoccus penangensis]